MIERATTFAGTLMTNEALTYALIEEKIADYANNVAHDKPGSVERMAFGIALVPWLPLMIAAQFVNSRRAVLFLQICAVLLLAAIVIGAACSVWREWRAFYRRHEKLSRELDGDYVQWRGVSAVRSRVAGGESRIRA